MLDDELAEIIGSLRALGGDHASVEAKRAETKLPRNVRETLSAFANTSGGVLILGLDESLGFQALVSRIRRNWLPTSAQCAAKTWNPRCVR